MERKPPKDLAALLATAEVLGPLSEERALWLAWRVSDMRFGRGQILYGPRFDSRVIFVLLEGRVRLYKALGSTELTLEIIEAGQLFGDVPAMASHQRGTYAQALAP